MVALLEVGRDILVRGDLLRTVDVHAVLADGRENVAGHAVLELLGLRLVAAEDQLVEAALRYDVHGQPTLTLNRMKGHLISTQRPHSVAHIRQAEDAANIRGDEPRLTLDGDDADGGGVEGAGGQIDGVKSTGSPIRGKHWIVYPATPAAPRW